MMGIETKITLDSAIFNTASVRRAGESTLTKTGKSFKDSTRRKMQAGPHTGSTVARKRGAGFRRSHRASAKGERPSPDTLTLINAVTDRKTGDTSRDVFIDHKTNPLNKADAAYYAGVLQEKLDRPVMDERDAADGEQLLQTEYEAAINRLL